MYYMINIYPSLMAADQLHLEDEIQLLEHHCAGFHLDVMDNCFVQNSALAINTVNEIAKKTKLVWVHLMVEKPDIFYAKLFLPTGSLVSFHIESEIDVLEFVKIIREKKQRVSVAISPKTPVEAIVPFLNIVDQILVMSVDPGFSGQPFLESSFDKITQLVAHRQKQNNYFRIGVDGGIDVTHIKKLVAMGVDDYAIGSAIFKHKDCVAALHELEYAAGVNKK